jgi:hypothetical protein
MLSRSLGASRKFARCGKAAGEFPQLLFALLVPHADDFGRMTSDAFTVKLTVFPSSPRTEDEFEAALVALEHAHLIVRYPFKEGQVLQIRKFEEHQRGLSKRTRSDFPAPPGEIQEIPQSSEEVPAQQNLTEQNLNEEKPPKPPVGGRSRKGRLAKAQPVADPVAVAQALETKRRRAEMEAAGMSEVEIESVFEREYLERRAEA